MSTTVTRTSIDLTGLDLDELLDLRAAARTEIQARWQRWQAAYSEAMADRMRHERAQAGLSVAGAARRAKVGRQTVVRAETRGTSGIGTLDALLTAYGHQDTWANGHKESPALFECLRAAGARADEEVGK